MPGQADGLHRLAETVARRRAELRLSRDACARQAGMSITTWRRVEEGQPVRDVTYARVDEVMGWPLGASTRVIEDPAFTPMSSEVVKGARFSKAPLDSEALRRAIQNATIATAPDLTGAQIQELQERAIEELRRQGLLPGD
ncbi:helix-turn-helix domain-containing protein [Kitasatospora sp. NPDC058478]|uniref:helix-turn-helix domain-containing protein n=1 Tax=unclassified Kitasatospora TaxID=2633591 RepID=UPI0036547876